MGLQDFTTNNESNTKDKKVSDGYCPECEKKGKETEHWYWRCTTSKDECKVLTFIPANYERSL